jgi:4-nitrophenyl phosphatase
MIVGVSVVPVVLLDLDGVVWLAHEPIPGSVDAIARLRAAGVRVLFVTNNSAATVRAQESALTSIGVPAEGDVLTSALAAATLVAPGTRALVAGGAGVVEALEARGVEAVLAADPSSELGRDGRGGRGGGLGGDVDVDAVVVGFHRNFDYEGLRRAAAAVRSGALLIGTNDDATYPTPQGPIPGGGALVAAVEVASGCRAVLAGKPHEPMAALVRSVVGDTAAARAVMVGDRGSTDGGFARRLGCRFAQVWSGVTPGIESLDPLVEPVPDLHAQNLAGVVDQLLGP